MSGKKSLGAFKYVESWQMIDVCGSFLHLHAFRYECANDVFQYILIHCKLFNTFYMVALSEDLYDSMNVCDESESSCKSHNIGYGKSCEQLEVNIEKYVAWKCSLF